MAAMREYHRLGAVIVELCFLTFLEAGSPEVLAALDSCRASLCGLQMAAFSLCPHPAFPLCVRILGFSLDDQIPFSFFFFFQIPFSYEDTSQMGLRLTLMASFSFNYLLRPYLKI